jgi:glycosyltransferase involved in cell wall biosynthesis
MINKVIDYLSLGLPVITSLQGEVKSLIKKYNVGVIYDSGNLYNHLDKIIDNYNLLEQMRINALELYKNKFSADKIYKTLVDKLEILSEDI